MPRLSKALALSSLLLVAACEVGPDYQRPPVDTPQAYKEDGDWKAAQPRDLIDRGAWWSIYNDSILDGLEKQIDISNQNLKAAEAAYHEALAVVDETRSALFPTLTLNGSAVASGSPDHARTLPSVVTYGVGPNATWEPDVWGRIQRSIESDEANAEASAADLASARLAAQATLATDYFDLRIEDELKKLLQNTVVDDTRILKITQDQYNSGIAAKADVLTAQTQLESVESTEINVGVKRGQLEHAIAVLIGKPPSEFSIAVLNYGNVIPVLPAEVPSALLERRPDIAAAERQMIAANAQIGIATAAYYPNFTINASYGFTGTVLSKFLQASNSLWTVGPAVAETIFDGGARAAVLAQAKEGYAETVALYRQTVLSGFQQVEDNLVAQQVLTQQATVQDQATQDARKAEALTLNQYTQGIIPFNNVLTAQIVTLENQETELTLEDSRLDASVGLIEAMGGGWDQSQIGIPVPGEPPEAP